MLLVVCVAYSSTLKIMVVRSTERPGCLRTTRRYDPENRIPHRRENPKTEIYHNVVVYYEYSLRLDGGVTEDIRGVGNTSSLHPQPPEIRIHINIEKKQRYTALPESLKTFCGSAIITRIGDCHCFVT
jgi:hypothetical protein